MMDTVTSAERLAYLAKRHDPGSIPGQACLRGDWDEAIVAKRREDENGEG